MSETKEVFNLMKDVIIDFKKIKEIVSTETLIEVEVDMGWSKP